MGGGIHTERVGGELLMADYLTTDTDLTTVADAIRTRGGTSAALEWPSGFASAIVAIPTGGGSSWTKVAESTYTVSTTSTSVATVGTLATGSNDLWTSDEWVYVRVRDMAGKRTGYFYGSDQFFYNYNPANGETVLIYMSYSLRLGKMYTDNGLFTTAPAMGSTGYGVYADRLYKDGRVRIRSRYDESNSLTIDGTYKVEVYTLAMPDGIPVFG